MVTMIYFTLEELIRSKTAERLNIDNKPTPEHRANLEVLVRDVLDPLRALLGSPITVTSGYRSPLLNRRIGGRETSQHTKGEAADLTCRDNMYLYILAMKHLEFDQLIYETEDIKDSKGNIIGVKSWVHISYTKTRKNRKQSFKMHNHKVI